jgi:hypothetical protein
MLSKEEISESMLGSARLPGIKLWMFRLTPDSAGGVGVPSIAIA